MSRATKPRARTVVDGAHPDGPALAEHAVTRAVHLVTAIRDDTVHAVAEHTDTCSRIELVALAVALAALVRPDVDPATALEWIDLPTHQWSSTALAAEHSRWCAGARDAVALSAATEVRRRITASQHTERRAA